LVDNIVHHNSTNHSPVKLLFFNLRSKIVIIEITANHNNTKHPLLNLFVLNLKNKTVLVDIIAKQYEPFLCQTSNSNDRQYNQPQQYEPFLW
jgi:hypothetical protein